MNSNKDRDSLAHKCEPYSFSEVFEICKSWSIRDEIEKLRAIKHLAGIVPTLLNVILIFSHILLDKFYPQADFFPRSGASIIIIIGIAYALIDHYHVLGIMNEGVKTYFLLNPYFILPLWALIGTIIWGYGDLFPM